MDFRDPGYLSRSMNETIYKYEECLAKLGYPDNIQAYVLGDTRETNIQHKMIQDDLRSRACSVVTSYVHDCQHLLTRCLSTSSSETIRTQVSVSEIIIGHIIHVYGDLTFDSCSYVY